MFSEIVIPAQAGNQCFVVSQFFFNGKALVCCPVL